MNLSDIVPDLGGGVAVLIMLVLFGLGALVEGATPIEPKQPRANTLLNLAYAIFTGWFGVAIGPLIGIAATVIINAAGGGWIALPGSGWGIVYSAIVYLLAIDLLEYAFHRAQHAWPWLWAMHSFHHSDPGVNVTTTARHYWLEMPLKALFVYPLLAVLFKVPAAVLFIYALSTVWHYVNHLNVRWRIPVSWKLINNPQFHRIHHSLMPQHQNKNFAPYFPVWDLIFGTAYAPAADEYPPTGLADEASPANFGVALAWPFRRLWAAHPV
ncbi:MAG: sterol desaturase family protein [Alphaproteobacteria bacterium]